MDHSEAVQLRATEKYLLGDLPTDQREAFEDHFFACTECAQDVKTAAVFIDNARAALREAPVPARQFQPARQKSWWGWLQPAWGLAAAAAILAVVGYQNLVTIPHLKTEMAAATTPQALTSFNLTTAGSRGAMRCWRFSHPRTRDCFSRLSAATARYAIVRNRCSCAGNCSVHATAVAS